MFKCLHNQRYLYNVITIYTCQQYIDLLTNHIDKEDNALFVIGDQCMSPQDQASLGEKFCEVGCRAFGGQKREDRERMADELELEWPG